MFSKVNEFLKENKYSKPIIIVLLIIAFFVVYKQRASHTKPPRLALPITAEVSSLKTLPIYLKAIGNVSSNFSANIQAQVSGQILKIHFIEGQKVKKGDLLVEIDPSFYKAQVEQYQGQLERDKALLENALVDLKRYETLWKENSTSNQTLITQKSLVDQYKGTVKMDQGQLDNAIASLNYCTITAPFDGTMGILAVTEGNVVSNTTNIALINSNNPISVLFTLPESEIPQVQKQFNEMKTLQVEVYDQFGKELLATGDLFAIDNQVNSSTGTVQLKASFKNDEDKLFPNQFVNIKIKVLEVKDAITIPTSAIQYGPNGSYVYVISKDNVASAKSIKLGAIEEGQAYVISGLNNEELIATTGVDMLSEGAKVIISKRTN